LCIYAIWDLDMQYLRGSYVFNPVRKLSRTSVPLDRWARGPDWKEECLQTKL